MADENMQFPIPNSVLEPYIKQAVSTAITAALGDGTKLVQMAVQQALATKVNSEGRIDSRYTSDNKYNLVEIVAKNKIIEIARVTISEMAEQMRPKIKTEIEKYIKSQTNNIAKAMVDGVINGISSKFSISVEIR